MIYQCPTTTIIGFPCMVFQIVTNGIYRSIEHRATVNSAKERLSLATFYNPRREADIGHAPSLITQESPALFKRIGARDYLRGYLSRELDGKTYIDGMKIQNEEQKGT
uniref:Isopenicillin N synthase-like Fe(2+) 2OG dioxygenase domain-containing protein n=1 Tax=Quercus lobata TaxID=97700 RepID=A0A7N2R583_QUELO